MVTHLTLDSLEEFRYQGTLVTVRRVAQSVGVPPRTVHYWIAKGMLRGVFNVGGMWLIPKAEMNRIVEMKRRITGKFVAELRKRA